MDHPGTTGDRGEGFGRGDRADEDLTRLRSELDRLRGECDTLRWAVGHDELTGLPNRRLFTELATETLHTSPRAAVMVLDLDKFKPINDAYGHDTGDKVLQIVARRISGSVHNGGGHNGIVGRLGGDEFIGIVGAQEGVGADSWWVPAANRLLTAVAAPMMVAGNRLSVSGSVGVAVAEAPLPVADLIHRADLAMYEAKVHHLGYAAWDAKSGRAVHVPDRPPTDLEPGAPALDPYDRRPGTIAAPDSYRPGDPVWVFRHGGWRPGVVESASWCAVLATYRRQPGAGTVVDTMGAECVLPRTNADPNLDPIFESYHRVA